MKTNSSSATQENTNRPIIWTQRTRYCVYRIPQLVLILSQINPLHAYPKYLRYLHFHAAIRHAVYAQPLIMFTNTMFDADISKTYSNREMFVSESQYSRSVYYCQHVNTSHTERTIMNVLPSVGFTEH
jgi:hypothetical protein